MVRIWDAKSREVFNGLDGGSLELYYDNVGEPYREGVRVHLKCDGKEVAVLLAGGAVERLRDHLNYYLSPPENVQS